MLPQCCSELAATLPTFPVDVLQGGQQPVSAAASPSMIELSNVSASQEPLAAALQLPPGETAQPKAAGTPPASPHAAAAAEYAKVLAARSSPAAVIQQPSASAGDEPKATGDTSITVDVARLQGLYFCVGSLEVL